MAKLKFAKREEYQQTGNYIDGVAVLEVTDENGMPHYRPIHKFSTVEFNNAPAVMVSGDDVKIYPLQGKIQFNERKGIISFISYNSKYVIRGLTEADGVWMTASGSSMPEEELEKIYWSSGILWNPLAPPQEETP